MNALQTVSYYVINGATCSLKETFDLTVISTHHGFEPELFFHFTTMIHATVNHFLLLFASFTLHWKNDRRLSIFFFFQNISKSLDVDSVTSWYMKKNCIYAKLLLEIYGHQKIRRHSSVIFNSIQFKNHRAPVI